MPFSSAVHLLAVRLVPLFGEQSSSQTSLTLPIADVPAQVQRGVRDEQHKKDRPSHAVDIPEGPPKEHLGPEIECAEWTTGAGLHRLDLRRAVRRADRPQQATGHNEW
jgi:hypothetical protein